MESRRVPVVRPPLHLHLILDPGPKHAGRLGSPNLRPSRPNLAPNWSEANQGIREGERTSSGSRSSPWKTRVAPSDDSKELKNSSGRTDREKKKNLVYIPYHRVQW